MNPTIPLEIKNLSLGYKEPLASNINLTIKPKEFVTLMGENGCGKTTLIDCMAGGLQPIGGEIRFWGVPNLGQHRATVNQKVGWVISQKENYPLLLTVEQFLHDIAPFYPSWNWNLCNELCSSFDLDIKKKLFHLSLGEHSKVRLIKAISFEPSLIILDELTANLSPSSKKSLLSSLLDLFSRNEMSVLYICHSNEEALRLSDRIYEMDKNGLKLSGGQNV